MTQVTKSTNNIWKYIAFLLMGIIIGYIIGRFELTTITFKSTPSETQQENDKTKTDTVTKKADAQPEVNEPVTVNIDGDHSIGKDDAKIVLVDFSDYQ